MPSRPNSMDSQNEGRQPFLDNIKMRGIYKMNPNLNPRMGMKTFGSSVQKMPVDNRRIFGQRSPMSQFMNKGGY